jgi:hypothetical protein
MKTKIKQTYLPVLSDLYKTYIEPDELNEMYQINTQRQENNLDPLDFEDLDFDDEMHKNIVCRGYTSYIEDLLSDLKIVKRIKFEKLVSAIKYNFANDSIDVEIEFFPENLSKYINEHFDSFQKYIKDRYTSYDAEKWREDTENFTEFSDFHKLGSCLFFVYLNESENNIMPDMYFYIRATNVYFGVKNYEFETKKVKCPICGEFYLPTKENEHVHCN